MVSLKGLIVLLKMEAFDKMFFLYQLIYDLSANFVSQPTMSHMNLAISATYGNFFEQVSSF